VLAWTCVVVGLALMPIWIYLAFSHYFDRHSDENSSEVHMEQADVAR